MAGVLLELGRGHLTVVAEMAEVHHGRVSDPLIDGHGGDVAIAGEEVHRRIDVRVGVTGDREHRGLEDVTGGV